MMPPIDPDWPIWALLFLAVIGFLVLLTAWGENTASGRRFTRWLEQVVYPEEEL